MASQGQYQSFALIGYSAINEQKKHINLQLANGCNIGNCMEDLYLAKNINDAVFNYSTGCMSVPDVIESDILGMANYLKEKLLFTTDPIGQLAETTLNWIGGDFDSNDFNSNDFN